MTGARVLVVVENLSVPSDRRVWQESRALTDAGYEVTVVCPQGATRDTEADVVLDGVRVLRYPLRPATGGPAGYFREYLTALWSTVRLALKAGGRRGFDVVHICNPPDLLFLVALPFKLRGARVVFDHHDLVPELFLSRFDGGSRTLYRLALVAERVTFAVADQVLATNESYRRIALERGRKRPEQVSVVRSAPDLGRFQPRPPEPELKRGKPYLVCYVGVMGPQDGVDLALQAIAQVRQVLGRDDLHTALIGHGDAYDGLVELARDLGLGDCVEFTGWASDEDLSRYLATADVCLSPDPKSPLNDLSTMNKVMEYMAMGRPVVSFDLKETRVSAGDAAVYAPPNDVEAFGRLIVELLDDGPRREAMGIAGRERVARGLSWESSRATLVETYSRLL